MTDWVKIIDEAVEAACENVWNEVHGDLMGPWPEGCPDPEEFRREEREALTPAIGVFKDRGVFVTPEHDAAVAAKALREAATDAAYGIDWDDVPESVESWLRDRADHIERGESDD